MERTNAFAGQTALSRRIPGSPEAIDRGLITACAVIWLLVLGMGVAAAVALVDLGRGHPSGESGSGTPWLLYVIIAISALVIALAIPLLLRARRTALLEQSAVPVATPTPETAPTERLVDRDPPGYPGPMPSRHTSASLSAETLDRMWLRCGVGVLAAAGAAMFAVALAAYLLAVASDSGAWIALSVAALITIGMGAIPLLYLRQLHAELSES